MEKNQNENFNENCMIIDDEQLENEEEEENCDNIGDLPNNDKCISGYIMQNKLSSFNKNNSVINKTDTNLYNYGSQMSDDMAKIKLNRYGPINTESFFELKYKVNGVRKFILI